MTITLEPWMLIPLGILGTILSAMFGTSRAASGKDGPFMITLCMSVFLIVGGGVFWARDSHSRGVQRLHQASHVYPDTCCDECTMDPIIE